MSWLDMLPLFGGIGLFLYGMMMMSAGLKNAFGDNLRVMLEKATSTKLTALFVGTAITIMIQSSSATDVMVIGFVSSGLMTLSQAIGIIMGANIGTTVTAQIAAFNIGTFAPMILFVGAIATLFIKNKTIQYIGEVILGFGMLFCGISMMKSAIAPLAQTESFIHFVSHLTFPPLMVLFGIAFTALLQSSSSSTVIFQTFAIQGIIDYRTAVYLVIGSAVGAVTPNLLAGLTSNHEGKQCSILNLIFNLLRAALILIIITLFPALLEMIQGLTPGNIGRQIANTHTIFAIISVCILLPFSHFIVAIAEKMLPDKSQVKEHPDRQLVFLSQNQDVPPAFIVNQAHQEISRMAKIAHYNLLLSVGCLMGYDDEKHQRINENEDTVDYLANAIITRLIELRSLDLSTQNISLLYHMIQDVDDIERISDYAVRIAHHAKDIHEKRYNLSSAAQLELKNLAMISLNAVTSSLNVFIDQTPDHLEEASGYVKEVSKMKDLNENNHVERLLRGTCHPEEGVIFTDLGISLKLAADHAFKVARSMSLEDELTTA